MYTVSVLRLLLQFSRSPSNTEYSTVTASANSPHAHFDGQLYQLMRLINFEMLGQDDNNPFMRRNAHLVRANSVLITQNLPPIMAQAGQPG